MILNSSAERSAGGYREGSNSSSLAEFITTSIFSIAAPREQNASRIWSVHVIATSENRIADCSNHASRRTTGWRIPAANLTA